MPNRIAPCFVLLAIMATAGCQQSPPTATCQTMCIQRLGPESTDYLAQCQINNPNNYPLQVDDIRWTLFCGSAELTHGTLSRNTELPANRTCPLSIYVPVPHRAIERAGLAATGAFDYRLVAHVGLTSPLGPVKTSLETAGRMPIIHPLSVNLDKLERIGANDTRVGVSLTLTVANPNDLALTPSKLIGQLLINDRPMIDLDIEVSPGGIPARSSRTLGTTVWVTSPEIGAKSLDKIIQTPDTAFRIVGQMRFHLPAGSGDVNDMLCPASQPN